MRVDAHHHLWTLARGDYGWLTADLRPRASIFGKSAARI
jgi:L-fuconolactonase